MPVHGAAVAVAELRLTRMDSTAPAKATRTVKSRLRTDGSPTEFRKARARPIGPGIVERVTKKDRSDVVGMTRTALIVAAMRRSILTYGELGSALGMDGGALRNEMRHILDCLSDDCIARSEPSLAALVVNQRSGAPGQGWQDGDLPWHAEVQAMFRRWA